MLDRVLPHLGERQRRLVCGALAGALGHGGVTRVAELAGLSIPTVIRGASEWTTRPTPTGAPAARVAGPSHWWSASWACLGLWTSWSTPTPAATPNRRCAGRPSPPGTWPRRLARRAS